MFFNFLDRYRNFGLLFLRVGMGVMFMYHGGPKLYGGPEKWAKLGTAMNQLGIHSMPVFWGFMAAFAEFFGGIGLMLGFFFRPACALLCFTMIVAATKHLVGAESLGAASHAIEAGIVFFSLLFIGPGDHSIDGKLLRK